MNLRYRWQRIAALALLLLTFLIPVSAASAQTTDKQDPFGVGLGASQKAFEAQYGAATSEKGAKDFAKGSQYAISGYKSVNVYWHGGYSAHIVLTAKGGWTESKAVSIANRFLPTDVKDSNKTSQLSDGSVLVLGHSAALAKRFSAGTYKTYGVGGKQGDLRVVLIPGASGNTVGTIDIAIGVGDELGTATATTTTPATTETPTPASKGSTNDATYLKTVRKNVDALQKSVDTYDSLIQKAQGGTFTKQDQTDLITVLTEWLAAPGEASALKAPSAYADIQTAYEQAANDLSGASIDITNYLSNGGTDSTLAQSAASKVSSARNELSNADQLLTAAGA